ncbi:MAG: MFS transporter [Clostridia bacterium]|nr:MFS transporter [Clostridia bacterium]
MKPSLKQDNYPLKKVILFLASQNISLFGSNVVGFAIIWHITLQTSSGKWVMAFTICSTLPQVLISLWAGVWADRYNRKYLIMLSDTFIALATFGLAVAFWSGYEKLELLLAVSVIRSLGGGIQVPAVSALFPQIVPVEKLTRIQGINQTLNSVLLLLSPAVGGLVLGTVGIFWAFLLDVITASLAVIVLSFIQVEKVARKSEKTSVLTELRQGLAYSFNHKLLRLILIGFGLSVFLITPAAVLTPLLVERTFGGEVWRLTANEMVWTIGSLVGGFFVSLKGEFKDKILTAAICLVAFGVTFALLGIAGNFTLYLLIMGISGFFMPLIATSQTVLIQEIVEPTIMGRVFSLVQIVAGSAMPVAILLFGPLADMVSIGSILLVTGVMLVAVGIWYRLAAKGAGLTNR